MKAAQYTFRGTGMVVLRKMIWQAQGSELIGPKRLQEKAALVFKNAGN
jgi:hypothetical protein